MIKSVWKFGDNVPEVIEIRNKVGDTASETDNKSIQLVLMNDDIPVACGSLFFNEGSYRFAHFCVIPEMQHQYVGDMLIRILLLKAFNMGAECVKLTANAETVDFFKKYGFIASENFNMTVTPETLIMASKCGHDCANCINKDICKSK